VVEVERQVLVGLDVGPEDVGDHFLVGGTEQHLAVVAVVDAQHLLAVIVVAATLPPQVGGLDGRHQDLDGAGPVLLLSDDVADLVEHALAQRQPRIDPRGLLFDHAGTRHQAVRDDFRILGIFLQNRQEVF
jgi:hypothetical protein